MIWHEKMLNLANLALDSNETLFAKLDALNQDASHFQTSNDICTPMGCVKEMVDAVPASFWRRRNLRILDSCCGNGNFHAYISTKVPLGSLYFNEINQQRIDNVRRLFGEHFQQDIHLSQRDFLAFDDAEQFDMVVANPPYAQFRDGKRVSKNHNLARPFIQKALNVTKKDGMILFIVPDNWMSYSDRNTLPEQISNYQLLHLNIHGAKHWFPKIGSSFTWFLLQKTPNGKPFTIENHYKKYSKVTARLDKGVQFIPLYYSDAVRSLMRKTIYANGAKHKVETTSDLHRYTKKHLISDHEDAEHKHKLIHTFRQTAWSSRPHKYQLGWKVFLSLSGYYETRIDNCGMTQSVAFVRCASKQQAKNIKRELDSPLYRALNNLTRYGNFNNIRILQNLPRLADVSLNKAERDVVDYFARLK